MSKPRYVYCVMSYVDTDPVDNVRRNGLMGIHSSMNGAESHITSLLADRRRMPGYDKLDFYLPDENAHKRHQDRKFHEYYCFDVLQYRVCYKFGEATHIETMKIEKRLVIGKDSV